MKPLDPPRFDPPARDDLVRVPFINYRPIAKRVAFAWYVETHLLRELAELADRAEAQAMPAESPADDSTQLSDASTRTPGA